VVISFTQSPTTANAGPDQTICGTSATLAGNNPSVGTGTWTILTGTGGSFDDAANPSATFSGTQGTIYTLRWAISNAICNPSYDDVVIILSANPSLADAGSDQTICGTSATLAAISPSAGSGSWSILNGSNGVFSNANLYNSSFTGITGTIYTLLWSVSNGACAVVTDTVTISFIQNPTSANAGSDQNICGTNTALSANIPSSGTGSWSIISGVGGTVDDATNPSSNFSGAAGTTYTLRWSISNPPCNVSSDDVVIHFYDAAIVSAGQNASVCANGTITLGGTISGGATSATWATNRNGTFSPNASALNAIYTPGSSDISNGNATLTLTTNDPLGPCSSVSSSITISIGNAATANAGTDKLICATSAASLSGSIGGSATSATWTSTGDGIFSDSSSLTSNYSPGTNDITTGYVSLILSTNIPNGSCAAASDTMILRIKASVPAQPDSITGAPTAVCPPLNGITLHTNNDPNAISYSWSLAPSITGITFTTISTTNNQTINIVTTTNSTYVIRVVANNICGASQFRSVMIRKTVGTPASVTGALVACGGSVQVYAADKTGGATSYKWTGLAGMTFNGNAQPYITPDTTVNVAFPANFTAGTVCAASQVGCFTSTPKCLTVSKSSPALNSLSGAASVCPGTTETYIVPLTAGAANYIWTLPNNTTGTSTSNTINLNLSAGFTSGSLCVKATSICGVITAPKCITITSGVPAKPASITGPLNSVCGQTATYAAPVAPGCTYGWTVPVGATINGASNGNSISISLPSNISTGSVCVTASNSCGTSLSRCITIKGAPSQPGVISCNPSVVCANATGVNFTVPAASIVSSDNFTWTYPLGTINPSGIHTPSLMVDWGTTGGNVSFTASNSCGTATRAMLVTIGCLRLINNPSQQNNNDGKTNDTKTDVTQNNALNPINLQAYPDADQKTMTFTFNADEAGEYTCELYDDSNRQVYNGTVDAQQGVNMQEIDMNSLQGNTIYRLVVTKGDQSTHINITLK
jgi:hypothetical protein